MKHLTLILLLALAAPPSWGEDPLVFYCVEEHNIDVESIVNGKYEYLSGWSGVGTGELKVIRQKLERFQYKWDGKKEGEIVITGEGWTRADQKYSLQCDFCRKGYEYEGRTYPLQLSATSGIAKFTFTRKNFFYASAARDGASIVAGTCTKF